MASVITADGYTFTVYADGSVGDGDLSWPNMQAFLDSRDRGLGGVQWTIELLAGTEMSEEEVVDKVREMRTKADERVKRIDTVRRALLAAANVLPGRFDVVEKAVDARNAAPYQGTAADSLRVQTIQDLIDDLGGEVLVWA